MSSSKASRSPSGTAALLALAVLLAASGCASSRAYDIGQRAERADDFDQAVVAYTQAAAERPGDAGIRAALQRARLRASESHFTRGRRFAGLGRYDEAVVAYQLALELNPANSAVEQAVRETRAQVRTQMAVRRNGQTQLESVIARARELEPEGLTLPDATMPESLVFRDAGSRDVYASIARFADISIVFDPQFQSVPLSIDLRGTSLKEALDAVANSTLTFYRVTAPRTITVIPDTPPKRRDYDEEIIRTFYLSNADVKETIDMLRIVVDARRLSPITATNAISIKDTPERVAAAARLINAIDKSRGEVVIDVELLEVDRTRFRQYGLQILSPNNELGISGQVDVNQQGGLTLNDLRSLGSGDVFFTNLPGLYYRLLKQDANTRTLANPQLRTSDGLPAQARFGEEVPVPQVTFAPIATGGINQQPITSFTYRNVGVNIDITPRTHHNDDVSLAVKIEVSSLSATTGFSGLPIFGTRSITTTIRLRDGETNLLAGLIRDNERFTLRGVPGLSDIPVLGRLFASNERETQQTDIVLMLTPRIIRVLDLTEDDLRPFLAGRGGSAGSGMIEVTPSIPLPRQLPLPQQQQPQQDDPDDPFLPQLPVFPEQQPLQPQPLPPPPPPG
jgi:general secretion pathway protein D